MKIPGKTGEMPLPTSIQQGRFCMSLAVLALVEHFDVGGGGELSIPSRVYADMQASQAGEGGRGGGEMGAGSGAAGLRDRPAGRKDGERPKQGQREVGGEIRVPRERTGRATRRVSVPFDSSSHTSPKASRK